MLSRHNRPSERFCSLLIFFHEPHDLHRPSSVAQCTHLQALNEGFISQTKLLNFLARSWWWPTEDILSTRGRGFKTLLPHLNSSSLDAYNHFKGFTYFEMIANHSYKIAKTLSTCCINRPGRGRGL